MDEDWLELASGLEGSRYLVNTYYSGSTRNYTHLYDTEMLTSLWTAYPLSSSYMGSLDRPSGWSCNPSIDEKYQVKVTSYSYSNSTYSKGHMCPKNSRDADQTMLEQTFYVTNQVPQIQNSFNDGIWNDLEGAVQGVAESNSSETIYVVTGFDFFVNLPDSVEAAAEAQNTSWSEFSAF